MYRLILRSVEAPARIASFWGLGLEDPSRLCGTSMFYAPRKGRSKIMKRIFRVFTLILALGLFIVAAPFAHAQTHGDKPFFRPVPTGSTVSTPAPSKTVEPTVTATAPEKEYVKHHKITEWRLSPQWTDPVLSPIRYVPYR